jgi:L-rhamnose-H+ transport protein
METTLGVLLVASAGLITGTGLWPVKLMRTYQFEHWWLISSISGLFVMPWTITLVTFAHVFEAYRLVPVSTLVMSNLFAMCWGVANVLCGLCMVRIGVALTTAISAGLGASVAVMLPMLFKGSGLFKNTPGIATSAGIGVMIGLGVMLVGMVLAALAGFGRDREFERLRQPSGTFPLGLVMVVISGLMSAGLTLAFVYGQGPIVDSINGLNPGVPAILAMFSVWAVGLLGGSLVCILYAVYLLSRNRSWRVLTANWKETVLSVLMGIQFSMAVVLIGKGMLLLGVFGASVGAGILQGTFMIGGQGLGFIGGEWRGVNGRPRRTMYLAIATLIAAMIIMAYSNTLT